jgi:hypothetical protein
MITQNYTTFTNNDRYHLQSLTKKNNTIKSTQVLVNGEHYMI